MPTKDRELPNTPLNGSELKAVVRAKSKSILDAIASEVLDRLDDSMDRSGNFIPGYLHPRARISFLVKFQWSNPAMPSTEIAATAGDGIPKQEDEAESQIVIGTEQIHAIENPNLERLDAEIPFTRTDVQKAKPGEVFAKVQEVEIPVDPVEYANIPRTVPEVSDTSAQLATALNVSKEKLIPKRR